MSVVILDDSPVNLMLMEGLTRQVTDEPIHVFADPLDAMAKIVGIDPDVVLIDYMMPGIDGLEVIARLRADARFAETPLVMVTTTDQREVRLAALESGATDFLSKPIDASEFKARLKNLLTLKAAARLVHARADDLEREVAAATAALAAREEEIVLRLSRAAEYRDPETGAHIMRMAEYCALVADGLGLSATYRRDLLRAAPMHDVGKIGVPDHILLKPGKLTPEERVEVEKHAGYGAEILGGSHAPLIRLAAEIAGTHHEKWDGSGYPAKLSGRTIPLSGRIAAVADVFDALTSPRPYKPAWSLEEARDFLVAESGRHFDPACVKAFLARWDGVVAVHARGHALEAAA